ncbi:TauD/TfdA family dioxygenase [bacterium]|nr:TauD/TfdA family dioxygenase [bacterium]
MNFNYKFSEKENKNLVTNFSNFFSHPYKNYFSFKKEVSEVISENKNIKRFMGYLKNNESEKGLSLISNCPIDEVLPNLTKDNPVEEKRNLKKTFIAEAFLESISQAMNLEVIGHKSVNNGDFFHDIYPIKNMYQSQSQKTLDSLKFHKDFTNHFARPSHVIVLCLRNDPVNEIVSTFVENQVVIENLPPQDLKLLKQPIYYTPFDDISAKKIASITDKKPLEHAIIEGKNNIRYFEGRTTSDVAEAKKVLEHLRLLIHEYKQEYQMQPGDCVIFNNDLYLHGKEVRKINDINALQNRWLMKIHAVDNIKAFKKHFSPEQYGVVNG